MKKTLRNNKGQFVKGIYQGFGFKRCHKLTDNYKNK